jgi:hypothetical protein
MGEAATSPWWSTGPRRPDVLDTCLAVSRYLLENAEGWLGESSL